MDIKCVVQIMQLLKDERGKSRSFSIIITLELVHWCVIVVVGLRPRLLLTEQLKEPLLLLS